MSDYMTGQQLRDEVWTPTYVKHHHNNPEPYNKLPSNLRSFWDALAARVKMPRPKPPPTMGQVLCEYNEDSWNYCGKASRDSWESEAAKLRDALNAAFDAYNSNGEQ